MGDSSENDEKENQSKNTHQNSCKSEIALGFRNLSIFQRE